MQDSNKILVYVKKIYALLRGILPRGPVDWQKVNIAKVTDNVATICGNMTVATLILAFFDDKVSVFGASVLAISSFAGCVFLSAICKK